MIDPSAKLTWDDFRLIQAIAEARSLPGAAERLGVNHSTTFRRLRQIEDALGIALFEKHRTGYTVTAAGEEFVALAARLDNDITATMRKLAGREITPSGELRVATNDSLLVHLLTPFFAKFRQSCPDVRLDILIGNQPLNLARRDADVAIRATDNPPETLVGRRAARIGWALYGASNALPGRARSGEIDIFAQNWVSLGEQLGGFKLSKWVAAHVPPDRIVYKLNTVLGLADAVEAGIGIGYLPCFIADARPALTRLTPSEPEFGADLWLLTHPDLRHSPRVRVFLDFLAAEIAKYRKFIEGETAAD
jgi:DNA-binding transcriptional LysR family regulator